MQRTIRAALVLGAAAAALVTGPASDALAAGGGADHAVFVQTNYLSGNRIAAFHRSDDGTLTKLGSYPTGGYGGLAASAPVDALASQESLVLDQRHRALVAVNAGSDSISVFGVRGDRLTRRQVLPSGGSFPVSVAIHDGLAYVLNAGGAGTLQGFRIDRQGRYHAIAGSSRSLDLANGNPPSFIDSPAQVGFTPDGSALLVTTKTGNGIAVFGVHPDGRLADEPVTTTSAGPVPFAFGFDDQGHLLVSEAGTSSITSYALRPDLTLGPISSSGATGEVALCWLARVGSYVYGANSGSSSLSRFSVAANGDVSFDGVAATLGNGHGGPIDLATSADGRFLYTQDAARGAVVAYAVGADGSLSHVATTGGLPGFDPVNGGMEGIVAA